jgi:DNA-directed RNA polymerase subunit beta
LNFGKTTLIRYNNISKITTKESTTIQKHKKNKSENNPRVNLLKYELNRIDWNKKGFSRIAYSTSFPQANFVDFLNTSTTNHTRNKAMTDKAQQVTNLLKDKLWVKLRFTLSKQRFGYRDIISAERIRSIHCIKTKPRYDQNDIFINGKQVQIKAIVEQKSQLNPSILSKIDNLSLWCVNQSASLSSYLPFHGGYQRANKYFQFSESELCCFSHIIQNFNRSNQDICLVERALVQEGDWVQQGDILTDCSASDKGELAVGKNVLIAYLPWEGFNFEDAIVISDRLVKENVYTSLHIERYDFDAQDYKEGNEWFTNDLPGIASKNVKHLNELGLPKIGSFVKEGDILVGKIKYSNKKATTPYERLLCDILGEKNFAARDASLYIPRGVEARVIHHQLIGFFDKSSKEQVYTAANTNTTNTALLPTKSRLPKVVNVFLGEKRAIQVGDKMSGRHGNKGVVSTILPRQDMPYLADGTPIDIILNPLGVPSRMNVGQVFECLLGLAATYLRQQFKITPFDEIYGIEASQSLVYLKLYQARLQSGQNWLFQVDFPGKTRLIDGRSGEAFDQWVTVGKAYMLKLIHMVNEKIHARSTGPYALITQQPLRGRSQKVGQRLGEMEVWALQGFGAAYTLQELLTKKSDDSIGRKDIAASILPRPVSILDTIQASNRVLGFGEIESKKKALLLGQPEIFKVLVCELQALCLDIGLYTLTKQSFQRSFITTL